MKEDEGLVKGTGSKSQYTFALSETYDRPND